MFFLPLFAKSLENDRFCWGFLGFHEAYYTTARDFGELQQAISRLPMESFIVKQLHPHLHIPAAFCILKSCRAELHCKIEG